ncbi:MAG: glycosyltransferase family 2 protein, partial [Pseudomonadota bacterium]
LFGENLGYLKPLFRAKTLRRLGALYDTSLRNSEDFYLVAGLLAEGADMRLHPSRGYNYLVRPGSISHRLTPALTAAIVNADGVFAQKYARVFDTRCAVAHAKRSAGLRNMHSFERVVQAVKARKPTAILTALVERPAAMPHVASRLAGIAAAKFRRNEAS